MLKCTEGEVIISGSYKRLFAEMGQLLMSLKEMISQAEEKERIIANYVLEKELLFALLAENQEEYMTLIHFDDKNKVRLLKKVAQVLSTKIEVEEMEDFQEYEEYEDDEGE